MNDEIYMYNGLTIPCKVSEGAVSIQNTVSVKGSGKGVSLANPVTKGDAVAITGITEDGYLLVEKATGDNGVIIGFVHDNPEYDYDPTKNYTKQQAITNNILRKCGIETTIVDIRPVNVKAGENIAVGNYVKYGADGQKFEKSATETNIIALSTQGTDNRINIAIK